MTPSLVDSLRLTYHVLGPAGSRRFMRSRDPFHCLSLGDPGYRQHICDFICIFSWCRPILTSIVRSTGPACSCGLVGVANWDRLSEAQLTVPQRAWGRKIASQSHRLVWRYSGTQGLMWVGTSPFPMTRLLGCLRGSVVNSS